MGSVGLSSSSPSSLIDSGLSWVMVPSEFIFVVRTSGGEPLGLRGILELFEVSEACRSAARS